MKSPDNLNFLLSFSGIYFLTGWLLGFFYWDKFYIGFPAAILGWLLFSKIVKWELSRTQDTKPTRDKKKNVRITRQKTQR